MEDYSDAWTVQLMVFDGNTLLNTVEPANLQAMLATKFKDFSVGRRRYDAFKPLIGRSIFSSDGAFWEHSRALFRPQFSRENINDLDTTDRAASMLIGALGQTDADGWTLGTELQPLLYNFTLDTASDFLFGESLDTLALVTAARDQGAQQDASISVKRQEAQSFTDSLNIIQDVLVTRIRIQSLWWLGDGIQFRKALGVVRNFTERFVQLALDTTSTPGKPDGKKQGLLYGLATQTHNKTELRDQTLAILFAGRDTTAGLLGWAIELLAVYPDIFAKLRGIVLKEFAVGEDITFAKVKGCRYLQHFLNVSGDGDQLISNEREPTLQSCSHISRRLLTSRSFCNRKSYGYIPQFR